MSCPRRFQPDSDNILHRFVAIHEAGHAVAAVRYRLPFKRVWIDEDGGCVENDVQAWYSRPRKPQFFENQLLMSFAGAAATEQFFTTAPELHARSRDMDVFQARLIAKSDLKIPNAMLDEHLAQAEQRAVAFVKQEEILFLIEFVAQALLCLQTMNSAFVRAVCRN